MLERDPRPPGGIGYGLAAYGLWGLVPVFWPLVAQAGAIELLAHRVVWSLVVASTLLLVTVPRGWWARFRTRRNLALIVAAAAVISVNWGTYIWAVTSGHVVEASLGYYINPILSILVGVLLLGERLAPAQWASVGLAGAAVVVLTVEHGHLPWIALTLAVSFAAYGVAKNRLAAGAVESLTLESAVLAPLALGYLGYLQLTGAGTFGRLGWDFSLLLAATGLVTAIPLLFFAAAASRLPLSTLGLLQYLAPTLQFLLGVGYFGEAMSPGRWAGFALVWLALMILTGHGLLRARRTRRHRTPVTAPV